MLYALFGKSDIFLIGLFMLDIISDRSINLFLLAKNMGNYIPVSSRLFKK